MVVNDIHEEEQEFIVSKQQEDMDRSTIPRRELGNKIGGDDDEDIGST